VILSGTDRADPNKGENRQKNNTPRQLKSSYDCCRGMGVKEQGESRAANLRKEVGTYNGVGPAKKPKLGKKARQR